MTRQVTFSDPEHGETAGLDISCGQRNLLLLLVLIVGTLLRCYFPFWSTDFLVHDGGLHLRLSEELIANNFYPPRTTTYNQLAIPFVYPPLSTYVLALSRSIFGWDLTVVLRFLPAFISCLLIIAVFRLYQEVLDSNWQQVVAGALYCFLPHTFCQLVKSGGISRAIGALFCLLAMCEVFKMIHRLQRRPTEVPSLKSVAFLSAMIACTGLAHPEWALTLLLFLFSAMICEQSCRRTLGKVLVFSTLITAPWWGMVLWRHGTAPILAAFGSGPSPVGLSVLGTLQLFPVTANFGILTLGMVGVFACILQRRFVLPLFVLLGAIVQTRGFMWVVVMPFAYFVAVGLDQFFNFLFARSSVSDQPGYASEWQPRTMRVVVSLLLAYSFAEGVSLIDPNRPEIQSASPRVLDSFRWVRENTPESSRFILLTGTPWWIDYSNELFPALTGRRSETTCQGREWLSGGAFRDCVEFVTELQEPFVPAHLKSVEQTMRRPDIEFVLALKKAFSSRVLGSILGDDYGVVFENADVIIYRHHITRMPGALT